MSLIILTKHPKWPRHYLYRCLNCNWPEAIYVAEKAVGSCNLCGNLCVAVSCMGMSENELNVELENQCV